MEYRKDLDGLRAISIIFVVFYHLQLNLFNGLFLGGFIGVDIFFVLSGYLLTGLLTKNYQSKISIGSFYLKRSRRLLPSFYFVIFCSVIISYFFLISNYYEEFYKSVISATGIFSNFFFAFNSNYFDTPYFLKPLLHTWSLSIEFQFILFYPIFLYLCLKKLSRKKIVYLFSIIFFLNLLYIQFGGNLQFTYPYIEKNLSIFNPPTAGTFFYTTSRIWEFLAGAICFYISKKNKYENILYTCGVILIFLSLFFFSKGVNNPSINNIIPVIGTCLIITSNSNYNFLKKILSLKLFVFIGLVSYSLYLVHFPVISFSEYIFKENYFNNKISLKIFLFSLSFLISILLWKFIEEPFRNSKLITNKSFVKIIVSSFLVIIIFNYSLNTLKKKKDIAIKEKYSSINFNFDSADISKFKNEFNDIKNVKILILGDSQSVDLFKILKQNNYLNDKYDFAYFDSKFEFNYLSENTFLAKKFRERLVNSKKFKKSNYIIISTDYSQKDLRSFDKNIKFLSKFKKNLIVSNSFPNFSIHDPVLSILLKNDTDYLSSETLNKELFKFIKKQIFKINEIINIKTKENNLLLFDRTNLICNYKMKVCPALSEDNRLIFSDNKHLTNYGINHFSNSKYLKEFFSNNIKN